MKFATIIVSALAACTSFLDVAAAPVTVELESLAPTPLSAHLQVAGTFYRAVTRKEVPHIGNYPKGKHPKEYLQVPGDFSHDGALYVFADHDQAVKWGNSFASVAPGKESKDWYLVKFSYKPNKALKIKSFLQGTAEWKQFVINNYKKQGPHYDLIEGPVSVGGGDRLQPYLEGNHMVYQAAFVGRQALDTLIVEEVTKYNGSGKTRWCPVCVIMSSFGRESVPFLVTYARSSLQSLTSF